MSNLQFYAIITAVVGCTIVVSIAAYMTALPTIL